MNSLALPNKPENAKKNKKPRPSFAHGLKRIDQIPNVERLYDFIWSIWLKGPNTVEDFVVAYVLCKVINEGAPRQFLERQVCHTRHIDIQKGFIGNKIHPLDDEGRVSYTGQSIAAEIILNRILGETVPSPESYVFLPPSDEDDKTEKGRIKSIRKQLLEHFDILGKAYLDYYGEKPPTLKTIFMLGPFLAWQKGVIPFVNEVLSSNVLTASYPLNADLPILRDTTHPPIRTLRFYPRKLKIKEIPDDCCKPVITEKEKDKIFDTWREDAELILTDLVAGLRGINKGNFENLRNETVELLDIAEHGADNIAPRDSALHLAIDWTRHNILESESWGSVNTVATNLSNVFRNGFFDNRNCISLKSWEPEDYGLLLHKRLNFRKPKKNKKSRKKLKKSSKKQIIDAFIFLGHFIVDRKYSVAVDISNIVPEWTGGTSRTDIIGLYEFDAFAQLLAQEGSRTGLTFAVACILGFYAGLRSHSEVCALTLQNIVVLGGQAYVEIPRGKTKASRRRAPVPLIAPKELIDIVIKYVKQRKGEFRRDRNRKKIALFGPPGNPDGYDDSIFVRNIIDVLKQYFGEKCVFHTLRHSFASWGLLRWYALVNPDCIHMLRDSYHEVFTQNAQHRFKKVFDQMVTDGEIENSPSSLVMIAKLLGHAGCQTMFLHYIHAFHIIHRHEMKKLSRITGQRQLNGEVIANIFPHMDSASSRAKAPDKTMIGLMKYINSSI